MNSFAIAKQNDATESAAHCLASVASHFGKVLTAESFTRLTKEKNSVSMLEIVEASKEIGLEAEGYKVPLDCWNQLGFPIILNVISEATLQSTYVVCFAEADNLPVIANPETGKISTISLGALNEVWLSRTCIGFNEQAEDE